MWGNGDEDLGGENDFIMIDDLSDTWLMWGNGDEDLGEPNLEDPKDVEVFEEFTNCLDNDDLLFGGQGG